MVTSLVSPYWHYTRSSNFPSAECLAASKPLPMTYVIGMSSLRKTGDKMSRKTLTIFLSVVFVTAISGATAGYISFVFGDNISRSLGDFEGKLLWVFTTGAAAIIGLLGMGASPRE